MVAEQQNNFVNLRHLLIAGSVCGATFIPSQSHAFDCTKASTPTEEAICTRANLKSQDDAMSRIYFELREKFSKPARKQLFQAQKNWLAYRADTCGGNSDCLLDETQLWTITINTLSPGMVPVFVWQKGGDATYQVRLSGVRFAERKSKVEKLFNNELKRLLKNTPFDEVVSAELGYTPAHEINWEVTRFNKRIISVSVMSANYSGAHPVFYQDAINIDVQNGVLLDTGKLFSNEVIVKMTNDCRDQVIAVKYESDDGTLEEKRRQLEDQYPGVVREHIMSMKEWSFGDDLGENGEEVEINFDKYELGPYAEVPYQCYFSNKELSEYSNNPEIFAN